MTTLLYANYEEKLKYRGMQITKAISYVDSIIFLQVL